MPGYSRIGDHFLQSIRESDNPSLQTDTSGNPPKVPAQVLSTMGWQVKEDPPEMLPIADTLMNISRGPPETVAVNSLPGNVVQVCALMRIESDQLREGLDKSPELPGGPCGPTFPCGPCGPGTPCGPVCPGSP